MGNKKPTLNTNFRVRNVKGTTEVTQGNESWKRRCKCKTWMDHWRAGVLLNFPSIHPDVYLNPPCYVRGCSGTGTKGAHVVEIDGRATQRWQIVPFCSTHNDRTFVAEVFLTNDAILIPANQVDTCMDDEDWKTALKVVKLHQGDDL